MTSTADNACTLDDVRDALAWIDCNERDTWLRIGMAIKAEFGEGGFDAWDDWSQGYSRYKPGDIRTAWKSFRGAGVTIASLFKLARNAGWTPRETERSEAEKQRLHHEQMTRRAANEARIEAEEKQLAIMRELVAEAACSLWESFEVEGESGYLADKGVLAHGVRFVRYGVVVVYHDERVELIRGKDNISAFFSTKTDEVSFHYYKAGYLVVPMRNASGEIVSLQFIPPSGKKLFMKFGQKSGTFHSIGKILPGAPLCVAEGYATGATIHEATGWPVAVAWDEGNLLSVAAMLREKYPALSMIICGDDDTGTEGNPGRASAEAAAVAVSARVVFPVFERVQ